MMFLKASTIITLFLASGIVPALAVPVPEALNNTTGLHELGTLSPRATTNPATTCSALTTCSACVADAACGFDKTKFVCTTRSSTGQVTSATRCGLINQMQSSFPAANGRKAGIPSTSVTNAFNQMKTHILVGDGPTKPTGGRHTKSAWLANHPGDTPTQSDPGTHLLQYSFTQPISGIKTAWDNSVGLYDQTDIQNMCSIVIEKVIASGQPVGSFVVNTPFNNAICMKAVVRSSRGVTCFPVRVAPSTSAPGSTC